MAKFTRRELDRVQRGAPPYNQGSHPENEDDLRQLRTIFLDAPLVILGAFLAVFFYFALFLA